MSYESPIRYTNGPGPRRYANSWEERGLPRPRASEIAPLGRARPLPGRRRPSRSQVMGNRPVPGVAGVPLSYVPGQSWAPGLRGQPIRGGKPLGHVMHTNPDRGERHIHDLLEQAGNYEDDCGIASVGSVDPRQHLQNWFQMMDPVRRGLGEWSWQQANRVPGYLGRRVQLSDPHFALLNNAIARGYGL